MENCSLYELRERDSFIFDFFRNFDRKNVGKLEKTPKNRHRFSESEMPARNQRLISKFLSLIAKSMRSSAQQKKTRVSRTKYA